MAGHRKWSKVKQINGPLDQKRGQLFSKLAKEISVAARMAVVPETHVAVTDAATAGQVMHLEDSDDVQHAHPDFSQTEEALIALSA